LRYRNNQAKQFNNLTGVVIKCSRAADVKFLFCIEIDLRKTQAAFGDCPNFITILNVHSNLD